LTTADAAICQKELRARVTVKPAWNAIRSTPLFKTSQPKELVRPFQGTRRPPVIFLARRLVRDGLPVHKAKSAAASSRVGNRHADQRRENHAWLSPLARAAGASANPT